MKKKKKEIDLDPGKKELRENNMSLQITCLLLKYDVLITVYGRDTAGLWYCGQRPLLTEIVSCLPHVSQFISQN